MKYRFKSKLKQFVLTKSALEGQSITQQQIAAATGLSYTTVNRWYNNQIADIAHIEVNTLGQLCTFLHCTVGDLVDIE